MPPAPAHPTAALALRTTPTAAPTPPAWTAEALLLLAHAHATGLWTRLRETVRVVRGRAGRFEVPDFLLLLLLYALGRERTLAQFFVALRPAHALLAAFVQRRAGPTRSALSRWLGALTAEHCAALRTVLERDLLAHGLRGPHLGGLSDRCGTRHLFFDVDGTREVHRQRALHQAIDAPTPRRRFVRSCAPGYTGRKRGETMRTRTVVQQAHTHEWLGSFGHAGNGDCKGELRNALAAIARYLVAHKLSLSQGVVRLDGLYGQAWALTMLREAQLGFVLRFADYRVLGEEVVRRVLSDPAAATYTAPDSGLQSEVFEVPVLTWEGTTLRLLVLRRPRGLGKPAVGVVRGRFVYELFATDRKAPGLNCTDVLSLYHARGGFEGTLAQEDREQDPDRWVSAHAAGQECWQLLAQWVWNARLRLGLAANDPGVRTTVWADALPPLPPCAPGTVPRGASATLGVVCEAQGRGAGRFGGQDFAWTPEGLLRCPAGALLRPCASQREATATRVLYAASSRDCFGCAKARDCRGVNAGVARGRRVSVLYREAANDGPGPNAPVLWEDVAARTLRTAWGDALQQQRVDVGPEPPIAAAPLPRWTRARRAHRRWTWCEREARNAVPLGTSSWPVTLHGVPEALRKWLVLSLASPSYP